MNTITAGGKVINVREGAKIEVRNGVVWVDGVKQDGVKEEIENAIRILRIDVTGSLVNLSTDGDVEVHGDVKESVDCGDIEVKGNVGGSIFARAMLIVMMLAVM